MPTKGGKATLSFVDEWDGGFGWLAFPDERMARAGHALVVDGDVWLLDPIDADGVDDGLDRAGDVVGVVVCLDRHKRDAATFAARYDVPVYVPDWMTGVESVLSGPVKRFGRTLADTGYRAITLRNTTLPPWQEVGLYDDDSGTLYVPELVGTASYYRGPNERLGVHPMLRLFPPRRALGSLRPKRILVGHGSGIFEDATEALTSSLDTARRNAVPVWTAAIRSMLG